jgi:hypothetical protein
MISATRGERVEDVPSLDVAQLAREGLLEPGDREWRWDELNGWSVRVIALGYAVELRLGATSLGELELASTPCNFGGRRQWWLCSHCDRRARILYLVGRSLACRRCADLRYESQLEREVARGLRRARKIRRRLGGQPALVAPFPPKPPRMRWMTYAALRTDAKEAEAAFLTHLTARNPRRNPRGHERRAA